MKLERLESYAEFIRTVQDCDGDVYFHSAEGDHLNLKSTLCQYLFAAICGDKDFLTQGEVICTQAADYQRLAPFFA